MPTATVDNLRKYSPQTTELLSMYNWFTHLDLTQ